MGNVDAPTRTMASRGGGRGAAVDVIDPSVKCQVKTLEDGCANGPIRDAAGCGGRESLPAPHGVSTDQRWRSLPSEGSAGAARVRNTPPRRDQD